MFNERDHVHTLLYRYVRERSRDPDGLPAELALDHPSAGLVAVFTDRAEDVDAAAFESWMRDEHLAALLPGTAARLVIAADSLPLLIDAPGDVPRSESDDRRQLTLWFLDCSPQERPGTRSSSPTGPRLEKSGKATVVAALPFIPTIPEQTRTRTCCGPTTTTRGGLREPRSRRSHSAGAPFRSQDRHRHGGRLGHRQGHRHPPGGGGSLGGLPRRGGRQPRRDRRHGSPPSEPRPSPTAATSPTSRRSTRR